ncbi:MFS transporter, partial [Mesorhizobium sp. M4A.F.Ca.ET.050.02.1.1]
AWVYGLSTGAAPGIPGFGQQAPAGLAPDLDAARLAASDVAFAAVAAVTTLLCLLAAVIAWMTVSGQALPWPRSADESPADSSRN